MREKRGGPHPHIEGAPEETVRVTPLCYLEKIMLLLLGGAVLGSTPWKQSAGGLVSPPPSAGCDLHNSSCQPYCCIVTTLTLLSVCLSVVRCVVDV